MTVMGVKKDDKKVFTERGSTPPDDFDDWDSHFMLRNDFDDFRRNDELWGQRGWFKPSCVPITIILVLIVLVVLLPLIDNAANAMDNQYRNQDLDDGDAQLKSCQSSCRFTLVESIPQGMSYRNGTTPYPATFDVWSELIKEANHSLDIGSFYWTLRDSDVGSRFRMRVRKYTLPPAFQRARYPGSEQGELIFKNLVNAGTLRKLPIQIAQENPSRQQPNLDTDHLVKIGAAKVRSLNFNQILGSGVLHTKLWVTDGLNAYVGSANMDWRSLTQVKELGIYIKNCSCLAQDIHKIFDVYWLLGKTNRLPSEWPRNLTTVFNKDHPMNLTINNSSVGIYASSSPPQFCPKGRTSDIEAVIDVIQKAEKYIYIAVMDYYPLIIYAKSPQYWGVIDDALRAATVDNRVEVRILISWWKNSREQEKFFLKSLSMLTGAYPGVKISVKLFVVPASAEQSKIPYARVNHNKYMVTDNTALIGTSNWSGDYFTVTAGVSVVITGKSEIRDQLEGIFIRDWNSEFTYDLPR